MVIGKNFILSIFTKPDTPFRETAMLYEEGVSAAANKQRVATVVAHELAHQVD
jgi:Peptidase family M1 domain